MEEKTKLNAAQKEAVLHNKGPALVIAGAGTGKTAVISMRVAHLILTKDVPAESILALTFTDKAASEMQDRIERLLPNGYADSDILTFHAMGDRILREFGFELGLPSDFTIMSNFQQSIVMREVLDSLKLTYHKKPSDPFSMVSALLQFISRLKDENISSDDFRTYCSKQVKKEDLEEARRIGELATIYENYDKLCIQKGMIDYGDQIVRVIKLFENFPKILSHYQSKYQYILVDEYQDTNYSQSYLLKLLSKKHQNLMVVGDDDQSIYRFRGAAVSNILKFTKDYPGTKQIVLRRNYRSSQQILDSSYKLIQNNNPYRLEIENGISKKLIGDKSIRTEVVAKSYSNLAEEMAAVAENINNLVQEEGVSHSEIAILLRKNSQAVDVAHALQKNSVPFTVSESQNLFTQPEIKVLINFIHVIANPNASAALYGLLSSDLYRIPLSMIAGYSSKANRSHISLEQHLREEDMISEDISKVLAIIDKYRSVAQSDNAGQILYDFIKSSGYLERLVNEAEMDPDAVIQIQNITQFFNLIKDFEKADADSNIISLWTYLEGIRKLDTDIMIQTSPLDLDAVSIMTIHKSKGLEFRAVFLIDLVEQTFPARNYSDKIRMPDDLLPVSEEKVSWHIFEERRLFYVAATRAKQFLYMSCSFDHGGKMVWKPSRFILEATKQSFSIPTKVDNLAIDTLKTFERLPESPKDPLDRFINKDGWLQLTTNQVAEYMHSPKEFWYFQVLSLPKGPFHTLIYGSAIHAAIENYYLSKAQNTKPALAEMLKVFENSWSNEGFMSYQHEKDQFLHGKEVLGQFFLREEKTKDSPTYIEKDFQLKIDSLKLKITGRYDAVYDRTGLIEVRDFKTGQVDSQKTAEKRLKDSIQMKIYALAWERMHASPVDSVSLYFVEHDILAKSNKIDNEKTIELLSKVCDGIRNRRFKDTGGSRLNFEKLI